MSFKEWFKKIKKERDAKKKEEEKLANKQKAAEDSDYKNRFVKFYHLNKERLIKERRGSYSERRNSGICVRCKRKVVPGIVFCEYHQAKQREYNQKARKKE
jgi:hypothetical protein